MKKFANEEGLDFNCPEIIMELYKLKKKYPEINFIGIEKYESVMVRAIEKLEDKTEEDTEDIEDIEDAEDYMDGVIAELVTVRSAAIGKLKVESEDLELKGIVSDWKDALVEECMASEELCVAVRKKDKSLKSCLAKLIRFAFENKVQISDKIVSVTKVTNHGKEQPLRGPLYLGIPSKADTKKLIREYYLG